MKKSAEQSKRYRYLKHLGKSGYVPLGPVQEHLRNLHDAGMSLKQISEVCGIHRTRLSVISKGRALGKDIENVCIATRDAIMAVTYEPPVSRGARVDPTGTRRRIEALRADGFTPKLIGELSGGLASTNVSYMSKPERVYIHRSTVDRIARMYRDVEMKTPEDYGVAAHIIKRTKAFAAAQGYAPRHCWDDDTIDNPDAIPEWTGRCGTPDGYRLHFRRDVPMCDPCKKAHSTYNMANRAAQRERERGEA